MFGITFDPRANVSRGVMGPFSANANSTPSCVPLAVDQDQISCGATTTNGVSWGTRLPAGLLSPAAFRAVVSGLF